MKQVSPSTKLKVAIKGWATTQDLQNYFQCSRSKAIRIKEEIKERYFQDGELTSPYQNAIPTNYLLQYDQTTISELKLLVEAEKLLGVKNENQESKDYQISQSN